VKKNTLSRNRVTIAGDSLISPNTTSYDNKAVGVPTPEENEQDILLSSGHRLVIEHAESEITIESPEGDSNIRIVLSEGLPVVELQSSRLRLQSIDDIEVSCRRYVLNTTEDIALHADGHFTADSREEMRLSSKDDIRVNGNIIWLN
jgi:hypothetical protein